jgi:hypothetical protein
MKTERRLTRARACSWGSRLGRYEFRHADALVEIELGLTVAARACSALAPDIRGMLDAEFVCTGDVILTTDPGSAPASVPRLAGHLVRAAPPMQAARLSVAPAIARPAFAPRTALRLSLASSELNGLAQSNSSVAGGYAL